MKDLAPTTVQPKKKYGKFEDYEIESAVRTVIEAEEIKNDSEKMKYVGPLLHEKSESMKKAITSIDDLRKLYHDKTNPDDVSEENESES